jgi:Kef-type K+ transport system membrane component KefB
MISQRNRLLIAVGFFIFWSGVLYAGADHPPPLGFIWLVLLCLLAAGIVYLRVPTYANWSATGRRFRLLRVFVDGIVAGLLIALIPLLFDGGGEPDVQPTWVDHMIWFAVLAVVGAANAMIVYFFSFVSNRLVQKPNS